MSLPSVRRRRFLSLAAAGAAAGSFSAIVGSSRKAAASEWGPLVPDPAGILDLPEGFSYAIIEREYDPMDDGYRVPARPDAMAAFEGAGGTLILMRNHENSDGDTGNGPYNAGQSAPPQAYTATGMGGVTRVVVDATTYERISSNLVLVGTVRNCGGGPSPWGWLTCEEDTATNHGYVFLCDPEADSVQDPVRIDAYGRCNHEAAAIDPDTLYAYITEDRGDSCFYRMVPADPADPFTGTLQALRVTGMNGFATGTMARGDSVAIEWVDLTDPTPASDTLRDEAQALGAATFIRGEGIWYFEGAVYVCATSGGAVGGGQIFKLDDTAGTLEAIAVSGSASVLDMPDNIAVAPWGHVYMAEDGSADNYLRYLDDDNQICDFARNAISDSEFAGVCFSPDGQALFVNIQGDGLTIVVTGPFPDVGGGEEGGESGTDGLDETASDSESDGGAADVGAEGCACGTTEGDAGPGALLAAGAVLALSRTRASADRRGGTSACEPGDDET